MRLHLTADAAYVSDDEGRICLFIETDEGDSVTVDIHAVALGFYDTVQAFLRPYVVEAEQARTEWTAGIPQVVTNRPVSVEDAIDAGYALDDPKSPGYHDRMVD